jgi:hypothetical protein
MAWTAPSTFVAGAILTAAQMNTNVRDNSLAGGPIYTNEAARDAAITSPFEGQRAYLTASTVATAAGQTTVIPTGVQTIYNGSVWVCVTQVGAVTDTTCSTTTTASFADPSTPGNTNPTVTLVTGTSAIVDINSTLYNSTASAYTYVSFAVSGATTLAGSEANSYYYSAVSGTSADQHTGRRLIITGLTAGTNTFTMKYKVNTGTGQFNRRTLIVQGIA